MNSYFKFLSRNKLYTAIEAFGLSMSLGFVLLLLSYARTEFSVGKGRPESGKVYAIGSADSFGMTKGTAGAFFHNVPEITSWTRYAWQQENSFMCEGEYYKTSAASVDSNFFKIFSYDLDGCRRDNVLVSENEVLLSRSFAKRLFGNDNPSGRGIEYSGKRYVVAGTVEDFGPSDVFKPCDVWFNFNVLTAQYPEMDNFGMCQTFVTIAESASPEDVAEELLERYVDYWPYYSKNEDSNALLHGSSLSRLDKIYSIESFDSSWGPFRTGNRRMVEILGLLAIALLFSAVFNYVNLTVALVSRRAQEMAMRRLLGESAAGIRMRYLYESSIFTFMSGIAGLLIAYAAKPFFESLLNAGIVFDFTLPAVAVMVCFLLAISILCALIPSSMASAFQPVDVIKGEFRLRSKNVFSKVFIAFQCAFSTILVAASLTMFIQLGHLDRLPKGYETDGLIHIFTYRIANKMSGLQPLASRLAALPEVDVVSAANITPAKCGLNGVHEDGSERLSWIRNVAVDSVAFRLLGFEVKEQFCDPLPGMWYVDEETAARYGVNGEKQYFGGSASSPEYSCCGIVAGFRSGNVIDKPEDDSHNAVKILGDDSYVHGLLLKVSGDRKAAFDSVTRICREYCREIYGIPLELEAYYLDDVLDSALQDTRNMFRLVSVFMIFALLVSSLGILAMSIYYTEQHNRNIALRKVYGADLGSAVWTLSRGFILLSAAASLLSVPLCDIAVRKYLQNFHYAVQYPWYVLVIAVTATVVLTIITIAANTLAAASRNPVNVLKQNN